MSNYMKLGYAEFTMHWDDAPLDISWMFADEVPAGKHGFLRAEGGRFVFADGAPGRFWGTLINSAACFPPHDVAEKTARRLAKFGVNIVRLHQFDAEWAAPNIFQFAKGRELADTMHFDSESLDRFDYLVHCLKQNGIYIYMDLLIYRTFKPGDGVDNPAELPPNGAKPYSIFDPKLIELQQQYARDLLTHVNSYTGLAYVDDPAMAMVLITNENDMFNAPFPVLIEPYRSRLEQQYRAWAEANQVELPAQISFDFRRELPTPGILRFYHALQKHYLKEMYVFLRSIGVKAPIAGDSWSRGLTLVSALEEMDFTSSNVYWDLWGDTGHNRPLVAERRQALGMVPAKIRTAHQPLFITEWDMVWPHEWRSMSALMVASMADFQEWAGATLHTYRYRSLPANAMGGTVLGGIKYRRNFETFMDPAKFGMFYAAAVMFRRHDVAPACKTLGIALKDADIFNPAHGMANHNQPNIPAALNCEKHRLEIELPGRPGRAGARIGPDETGPAAADADTVTSDTGEMFRSWRDKYGWIDTPRSKAVYGFFQQGAPLELKGLRCVIKTDFAAIAFTSLSDLPLAEASQILVTAVGRADNTGAEYNDSHTARYAMGHTPVIFEIIRAEFEMATCHRHLKVWSVDQDGAYTGLVPGEAAGGKLKFKIGETYPSIYYLITR